MTISGDNTYIGQLQGELAAIESDIQFISNWSEKIEEIVDELFPELQRDDVSLDTTDGVVTFQHPNNGKMAERQLDRWVDAQMFWRDEPEVIWDAFPEIVGQLCDRVLEVNRG